MSATPSTLRLRARLVALVALLVAFDVAFVAAVYVLAHVAAGLAPIFAYEFDALFWSLSFDYVPLLPVLAVGTPLVLVVQSVFGYRMAVLDVGTDAGHRIDSPDPDSGETFNADALALAAERGLEERVARLSQVADVTPPAVRVIESPTPNSFVASRPGERTLFVTTGLLERLDGDRLDAVLGHELAHLQNGDSFVMTAAAFLPTVTARFNDRLVGLLRRSGLAGWLFADEDDEDDSGGFAQFEFGLIAFALVALPVVGTIRLASTACYRLLSRVREFGADAGGVALAGSPAALADALETLTGDTRPDADLRTSPSATGVRELCVLPYAIDGTSEDAAAPSDTSEEAAATDDSGETAAATDDGDDENATDHAYGERALGRWTALRARTLPGSHPDTDARVAALRERQAEIERGG